MAERSLTFTGMYHVELLATKTRIPPMKPHAIPRLEYWLGSKTALCWINNRGKWKQFIWHRLNEILNFTRKDDWGYYPLEQNPADLGSRGVLSNRLKGNELRKGPRWLSSLENGQPVKEEIRNTSESLEEIKETVVMEIQVNETGEMGEGRPRNDDGQMAEDLEKDNVDERRHGKAATLDPRWSPGGSRGGSYYYYYYYY